MSKASVKAPANIAFIKYWGKTNPKTRVPQNNSISMCLSELHSHCTIDFSKEYKTDQINFIDEAVVKDREFERIRNVIDHIRKLANSSLKAKLVTKNNFPKATGIASSASGLSAITLAAVTALKLKLTQKELSMLARFASGTAARSIPDGFVEWEKGTGPQNSYAISLHPPDHWDICDIVAIVTRQMKKVSSTKGHARADTSPFYEARLHGMDQKIADIKSSLNKKDFTQFGHILEQEALNMHAVCLTSSPPILYWEAPTIKIMRQIENWRETGDLECYYTIDAGPSVHAICRKKDARELANRIQKITGVQRVSINNPGNGARVIEEHLF